MDTTGIGTPALRTAERRPEGEPAIGLRAVAGLRSTERGAASGFRRTISGFSAFAALLSTVDALPWG
jgi:hypothetical protein